MAQPPVDPLQKSTFLFARLGHRLLLRLTSTTPEAGGIFLSSHVQRRLLPYYEAGLSKAFGGKLRVDANYYRRVVNNYADDDQIQNTTISFPIAFRNAIIYGAEGKIELPNWHGLSGFASYSYMVGNVWFPVTGGLFLGDDAQAAETQLGGHFSDSQDQHNTVRDGFATR